ncbi:SRPBCC family protein [Streptomyces sp. T-3]|nr:SRPBCC family protein [Streptomyces sp. T-3]
MIRFETVTEIAAPAPVVFELSLDVDMHVASMSRRAERAVAGVTTGHMGLGETVTWQARHFGLRWRMTSQISELERPAYFIDEQTAGPFKQWRHIHQFEPDGRGGTVMRDSIEFKAPAGVLGLVAESLLLGWYMSRLIRERNSHIKTAAERRR